jgi:GNAT superfamily N-acetyltransferase
MTNVHVRPATVADADAIGRLLDQLGYPTASAEVPARLDRLIDDGRAAVMLAECGGEVIGLATVHVLAVLHRRSRVAWLTALVVDEAMRGTGVGRALVEAVEELARQSGCERLSVTTHEDRSGAHAFYRRIGMTATGRRFGKTLGAEPVR